MIAVPKTPLDRWLPKLVLCLRQYNLRFFTADVIAGLTVGLVALPLAMAFGIASGVTPQAGIYTAVVRLEVIEMRSTCYEPEGRMFESCRAHHLKPL